MSRVRKIFVDCFDHDTDEPKNLEGIALDRHVLSTSERISCFWIEETPQRARRITKWIKEGKLVLDNSRYPWNRIVRFHHIDFQSKPER